MSTAGARLVPFVLAKKCAFFFNSNYTAVRFPSNLTCQAKYLGSPQDPSDMSVCVFERQTCELPTEFGKMFVKKYLLYNEPFDCLPLLCYFCFQQGNVQFKKITAFIVFTSVCFHLNIYLLSVVAPSKLPGFGSLCCPHASYTSLV